MLLAAPLSHLGLNLETAVGRAFYDPVRASPGNLSLTSLASRAAAQGYF
jgi:hypothetical protein